MEPIEKFPKGGKTGARSGRACPLTPEAADEQVLAAGGLGSLQEGTAPLWACRRHQLSLPAAVHHMTPDLTSTQQAQRLSAHVDALGDGGVAGAAGKAQGELPQTLGRTGLPPRDSADTNSGKREDSGAPPASVKDQGWPRQRQPGNVLQTWEGQERPGAEDAPCVKTGRRRFWKRAWAATPHLIAAVE